MALILVIIGALVALVGLIWVLGLAFGESPIWGLGCLFVPVLVLAFVALHPQEAWKAGVTYLVGAVVLLAGVSMLPA